MDSRLPGDHAVDRFDYLIAGGGLAGGLVAAALASLRPGASVCVVEQEPRLGGNHTWSFHDADLPDDARAWIEPLIAHRWRGYAVRFPDGERRFASGYASITSPRFDSVLRERLAGAGFTVCCDDAVTEVGAGFVRTASGRDLRATVVLDGRGPVCEPDGAAGQSSRRCGYQKFLGLEVELARDTPLEGPLLIDATVAQLDGFRFVYVLPFAPRRWLVEDTTYADTPALDRPRLRERVLAYLRDGGRRVVAVVREESGVLPLPFRSGGADLQAGGADECAPEGAALPIGYRGCWYHPLTGYSFPVAVRLALAIARAPSPGDVAAVVRDAWARHRRATALSHWLTRMMFTAVAPAQRWRLLARFYRLPAPTIARFYALRMTLADRVRLVAGWPPRWISRRPAPASAARPGSVPSLEEVS